MVTTLLSFLHARLVIPAKAGIQVFALWCGKGLGGQAAPLKSSGRRMAPTRPAMPGCAW